MKLLDYVIKRFLKLKLKLNPVWLGTSYGIDELTDIHVLVETWKGDQHWYGTRCDCEVTGCVSEP